MSKEVVVIPRSLAESAFSSKKRLSKLEAYIYLALNVNGDRTSFSKLASAWLWPNSKEVSRFLNQLKQDGLIDYEITTTGTLITVCATQNATPEATLKRRKTKVKQTFDATPDATLNATPEQTDLFGNPVTDPRIVALNKRFSVFNYDCDFSFVEPQLEDAFFEWLDYKKRRREKYKDQKSLQKCYNKMKKDCKDSSLVAKQMVEQSVANNYAGLFPIKDTTGGVLYGKILKGERDEIVDNSKEW